MTHRLGLTIAAATACWALVPVLGAGPTFVPDATFTGSSLAGWQPLGNASWQARDGEIVGVPRDPGGGWLMLDRSYQDVGVYASFRCADGCKAGLLLRAERTPEGIRGVYLSLSDATVAAYRVVLDPQGREIQREPLRSAGGMARIAPPPQAPAQGRAAGPAPAGARGQAPPAGPVAPVMSPPRTGIQPGEWNRIEVLLDANIVRWFLNDTAVAGGVAEETAGRYGQVALYAGGAAEVRFKTVSYKDLAARSAPPEEVSNRFRMQRLNEFYYSWSAAAADFDRDGTLDVVAGPYIYFGPRYTISREIYLAQPFNPAREYPYSPSRQYPALLPDSAWVIHASDFTGDGWPDVLTTDHAGTAGAVLYVNPKGEARRWDRFTVVTPVQTEITLLRDVDGDGRPELVYGAQGYVRLANPDPASPTSPWIVRTVSERSPWGPLASGGGHGLGVGDVNGDGRMDILNPWGWFEAPPDASRQQPWVYHPQAFGRWDRLLPGGGTMAVYDVNGDGRNDVVTALQAHGFGLAWFEQRRDAGGVSTFERHMVMDDFSTKNAGDVTFSELHGSTTADVDGDGVTDFIVGKRHWAHQDSFYDPDPYGPAVLYWYRTVRTRKAPGGAELVPNLIHNRSGVGSDVLAVDLNRDGAVDVATSTTRGTFIFWGTRR